MPLFLSRAALGWQRGNFRYTRVALLGMLVVVVVVVVVAVAVAVVAGFGFCRRGCGDGCSG